MRTPVVAFCDPPISKREGTKRWDAGPDGQMGRCGIARARAHSILVFHDTLCRGSSPWR